MDLYRQQVELRIVQTFKGDEMCESEQQTQSGLKNYLKKNTIQVNMKRNRAKRLSVPVQNSAGCNLEILDRKHSLNEKKQSKQKQFIRANS